jgi:hypothetical protein
MKTKVWICRDVDNTLHLHLNKPTFAVDSYWSSGDPFMCMWINDDLFPEIKPGKSRTATMELSICKR